MRSTRGSTRRAGHVPGFLVACLAAAIAPAVCLAATVLAPLPGAGNDFSSYWLAARVVAAGGNPYDLATLAELGRREHLDFVLGSGYSYPLPFALAMVPLSTLPFRVALVVFETCSIVAFAVCVAAWIARLFPPARETGSSSPVGRGAASSPSSRAPLVALAAGAYPPILGSVYFGQVNLLVVALLAVAMLPLVPNSSRTGTSGRAGATRDVLGGALIGLAGVVKLVPLLLAVPLALARRWSTAGAIVVTAAGSVTLAALAAPVASAGSEQLRALFSADGFWSNQSLNGLATRLVEPTDRTSPLLPHVVDPGHLAAALTVLLAALTAWLLLWAEWRPGVRGPRVGFSADGDLVRLATGLALTAGLVAAPKDSFWNHAPAILAVGLLLASTRSRASEANAPKPAEPALSARIQSIQPAAVSGPSVSGGPRRLLLGAWYGGAIVQAALDVTQGAATRSLGGAGSIVASVGTLALLALWLALAAEILERASRVADISPGSAGLILRG